jgi:anaerobic selenocysteine-containing dehydrogenase
VTIEDLDNAPHGIDLGPLQPSLLRRLETTTGKIECAPPMLTAELQRLAEETSVSPAADSLQLIGRRDIRSNNSWMHNAPRLVKGKPRHQLLMHPDDMHSRGLQDGARIRIRSRVGEVRTEVQRSAAMMPGVVCLPHGFGHQRSDTRIARAHALPGESYNDLSDSLTLDGASGNAAFNGMQVWVEPSP